MIEIWHPRYYDNKVLIAKHKVSSGINRIVFTKANSYKGKVFEVSGSVIASCPLGTNGRIACYIVPMDKLEVQGEG